MKKIIAFAFLLFALQPVTAQSYDQAIALLKENKSKEAIASLKEQQQAGRDLANVSLALSVIESDEGHFVEAFNDFKIFFDNHPNPYPYFFALHRTGIFFGPDCANAEDEEAFMKKLIADPKANNTIKSYAINFLGLREEQADDFEAARKLFGNYNDVKNWSTVGDFENVSGSGFNKDFGALAHPEREYQFTNKRGATVQWFDIPEVRNDRWLDMGFSHNTNDAIIYSQTFINCDADRDVILSIGVSGSLKAWVNDFVVASESEERNTGIDVYAYKIKLQKGVNRLLLQTGSSEVNDNNFLVRIEDENGHLITDLKTAPNFEPYVKAKAYEVKQIPFFAEQYFEDMVAKDPSDLINQIMLLNVYNLSEKKYAAHKAIATLKKMAPHCTMISEKIIETANIDKNVTTASRERESIKSNDPEGLAGLELRAYDASQKENWEEAIALINKRVELFGQTAETERQLITVYTKKKDLTKASSETNAAFLKFPDNETIAGFKYYLSKGQNKDSKISDEILDNYIKNNYNERVIDLKIENGIKSGNAKEVLKLYQMEVENRPVEVKKYLKITGVYFSMRDYENALFWIQKAMKLTPYSGSPYYSAGIIYDTKGDKAKAIEMMRKCIYYAPKTYLAREKLRTLENKKKLSDYFVKNDAEKTYKRSITNENYTKEEAVILINDLRQVVYPEQGAGEEQVELLIYINSQSAIQRFKEYTIPYNSFTQKLVVEKAEVYKKDGNKVPAERQKGNIVFSSMGVGDALHLSYNLENSYEGKLSEQFWKEFCFNSVYPTELARYSLIISQKKHFDYRLSHRYIAPQETDIDDYRQYTWEEKDIPKIAEEPLMDNGAFEKLSVTSIPDWNYVANWYSDVSYSKTLADFEIRELVKDLMAGNENRTELDKARMIYDYIENNYNYSSVPFLHSAFTPQRASRTMSTKLGDCKDLSSLFVSMAREAGLNANLVLVRTKGTGVDDMTLPTIAFNHCIAQLHAGGKNYFVELTNTCLPFSAIGNTSLNANCLWIPKDGENGTNAQIQKLNSDDRPLNSAVRVTEIAFDQDKAKIQRHVLKTGAEAANFRFAYRDIDNDEKIKRLVVAVSSEMNRNVKIENLKIENLKNLSDTVILDYGVSVDNFSSEIVGMTVFRLPWADAHLSDRIFTLEKRKYNLDLSVFTGTPVMNETISMVIPKGKKLAELPKDVTLSCPALSYSLKFKVNGDRMIATREMRYLKDVVTPIDYEEAKNTMAKISQADTKEFAVK